MTDQHPRFLAVAVIERTPLENRWVTEQWRVVAVVPEDREACRAAEVECIDIGGGTRWIVGGHSIELHRTEAEGYFPTSAHRSQRHS